MKYSYLSRKKTLKVLKESDVLSFINDGPFAAVSVSDGKAALISVSKRKNMLIVKVGLHFKLVYIYNIKSLLKK